MNRKGYVWELSKAILRTNPHSAWPD